LLDKGKPEEGSDAKQGAAVMGAMLVRHEPNSVAVVRHHIAADLTSNGVSPDRVDDVTLVASELVANAVRHAESSPDQDLGISWTITPANVLVSVADGSEREPRLGNAGADEPSGRGLAIIDQLSSTWGVEQLGIGKRVWARVPIE
jgi:serine/threonine-protein kinase RsbW